MRFRYGIAAACVAAAMTLASVAGPANAADRPDGHGARGAVAAVQKVAPGAVANLASAKSVQAAGVSVPKKAREGIQMVGGMNVGLPFADRASDAVQSATGVVVYDNNNGSSTVPVVHADGTVQISTVITSSTAPHAYTYPLGLPVGQALQATKDGGAVVTSGQTTVATIAAPWAKDANGIPVATHYEIIGNTLTQVVDFTASTAFPVTADPTYWWGGKKWLSASNVNIVLSTAGLAAFVGMAPAAALTGFAVGICNNAGRGIWVYWTWAGQVWCTGP